MTVPQQVEFGVLIAEVACSTHHGVALGADGEVFCFGRGDMGRLGLGDEKDRTVPTRLEFLYVEPLLRMPEFGDARCLNCVGKNLSLMTLCCLSVNVARSDSLPENDRVIGISCGSAHSLAITAKGRLYSWGYGDLLQLGNGKEVCLLEPYLVKSAEVEGRQVVSAQAGSQHSVILIREPTGAAAAKSKKSSAAAASRAQVGQKRRLAADETKGKVEDDEEFGDDQQDKGDDDFKSHSEDEDDKETSPPIKKQRQAVSDAPNDSVEALWSQAGAASLPASPQREFLSRLRSSLPSSSCMMDEVVYNVFVCLPRSAAANKLWQQAMDIDLP